MQNLEISPKDFFNLSKKMSNKHKMDMFLLDIILMVWYILGGITLGISNIFYFNPYRECIYIEIYNKLKEKINRNYC